MLDFSQLMVSKKIIESLKEMDVDQEFIDEFADRNRKFIRYMDPYIEKYARKNKNTDNILKDLKHIINRFE